MVDPADGRIPRDLLERMACSVDYWLRPGSEEKQACSRAIISYERGVGTREEALRCALLCDLYMACIPQDCDRLVTPAQRYAIERCACGEPYSESSIVSAEAAPSSAAAARPSG